MAKVYSPPKDLPVPEHSTEDYINRKWIEKDQVWIEQLRERVKKANPDDKLAGVEYSIPYADGNARYMVSKSKPLTLIWLPLGDAWQAPEAHLRGLRVGDIERQVSFNDWWKSTDRQGKAK